jgi:hypothetical protein
VFRRRRREDAGGYDSEAELADAEPEDGLDEDELDEAEFDDDFGEDDAEDPAGDEPVPAQPRARRQARAQHHDLGDPATWTRLRDPSAPVGWAGQPGGPWDAATGYPDAPRMDFGCLLVPMRDGADIQVNLDEAAGMWIAVVRQDSALQLQAFAAPKSAGIWADVRGELVAEVAGAGGRSQEAEGPFGPELHARLTPPGGTEQILRFMGVDGPRWFLRGLITGAAMADPEAAAELESIFADVVVVRGDHPAPPRKPLDIRLPEEARQALEQQAEAEAAAQGMPNPFERGPEITETR